MGLVYAVIELVNGLDLGNFQTGQIKENKVRSVKAEMLVDSGAYMLCINEKIQAQLELPVKEKQAAIMADGSISKLPIVGPVEVRFKNRRTSVDAMVLPGDNTPLLGAIPLEGMDVVIDPKTQTMDINPESPYVATTILKGIRKGK